MAILIKKFTVRVLRFKNSQNGKNKPYKKY